VLSCGSGVFPPVTKQKLYPPHFFVATFIL